MTPYWGMGASACSGAPGGALCSLSIRRLFQSLNRCRCGCNLHVQVLGTGVGLRELGRQGVGVRPQPRAPRTDEPPALDVLLVRGSRHPAPSNRATSAWAAAITRG